jgi:hypothetical protein
MALGSKVVKFNSKRNSVLILGKRDSNILYIFLTVDGLKSNVREEIKN